MADAGKFMSEALIQAQRAADRDEVPVGAVIVSDGEVIASDGNRTLELKDPTAHAEILVIRQAARVLDSERLTNCDLYVTLEPCPMCTSAISQARIRRLYYGAQDIKSGGVDNGVRLFQDPTCHHAPEVYSGFCESESSNLLEDFFKSKRV